MVDPVIVACVRPANTLGGSDEEFIGTLENARAVPASHTSDAKAYDLIFDGKDSQTRLFAKVLQPTLNSLPSKKSPAELKVKVDDVDTGLTLTVFLYGDSGTGKSHTVKQLLSQMAKHLIPGPTPQSKRATASSKLSLSAYELKHETIKVYDLIDDRPGKNSKPLKHACRTPKTIEESRVIDIDGLIQVNISSTVDLASALRKIDGRKEVRATKNNQQSSRSHCVFELRINRDCFRVIDLAGAENTSTDLLNPVFCDIKASRQITGSLLALQEIPSLLKSDKPECRSRIIKQASGFLVCRFLIDAFHSSLSPVLVCTFWKSVSVETSGTVAFARSFRGVRELLRLDEPQRSVSVVARPDGQGGDALAEAREEVQRLKKDLAEKEAEKQGLEVELAASKDELEDLKRQRDLERSEIEKVDAKDGEVLGVGDGCGDEVNGAGSGSTKNSMGESTSHTVPSLTASPYNDGTPSLHPSPRPSPSRALYVDAVGAKFGQLLLGSLTVESQNGVAASLTAQNIA